MTYEKTLPINKWAEDDRPREKLLQKGKSVLSDAELIAILIGSGSREESAVQLAQQILSLSENNLHQLAKKSISDLQQLKGIGEAKAISIVAALELGRRRKELDVTDKPLVRSSKDAFILLQDVLADLSYEEFWVLLLNRANKVISRSCISKGGFTGTVADPKLIFKVALEQNACRLILAHNHPSGNIRPSQANKKLTQQLVKAGSLLEIPVLDHLITGENNYFSFADNVLL